MQLIKGSIAQFLASVLTLLILKLYADNLFDLRLALGLQAITAIGISILLNQPVWWRVIHLLFMPALFAMLIFQIPSWFYFSLFVIFALVFWGTVKGDVPLFLSSTAVVDQLQRIVSKEQFGNFADIGAGLGTIVAPLAAYFPQMQIMAWERAPLPWFFCYLRCYALDNVKVKRESFWHADFTEYSMVFAFLSPAVMVEVGAKVRREMQSGSLFVSSSFPVPHWIPEQVISIADRRNTQLYCYRV